MQSIIRFVFARICIYISLAVYASFIWNIKYIIIFYIIWNIKYIYIYKYIYIKYIWNIEYIIPFNLLQQKTNQLKYIYNYYSGHRGEATAIRRVETNASRHHGGPLMASPETPSIRSTILLRGIRGRVDIIVSCLGIMILLFIPYGKVFIYSLQLLSIIENS